MRNLQAEQVIKLPRLTFAILLLLILTGAVGIAQQNNEDKISSIRGTYHPVPAHRAATVHKAHRPIVHVVIRRMASPRHVVHFATRQSVSARVTHHKKVRHATNMAQAHSPRYRTIMRKPFLEGKQALESKQTNAAVVSLQQNRKWVVQDQKYVEFSSSGVRFVPRDAKQGPNNVTTKFNLPAGTPWKVAFEVQLFPAANGGMSVYLYQGTTELGWIGAGDFYKSISGFLGTGIGNMPFSQTWDVNWHSFAYESDGKTLSLWHNGNKCGETTLAGTPDTFTIQSIGMELRVRNVRVGRMPEWDTSNVNIPYFTENFINPKSIEHWNGSNNGGSVTIGEKGLKLEGNGKGYPVLTSQSNPFPPNGNWTASFGYHYSSVGNYGTEIRCNCSNGDAVLLVHQDVHGQFLTLNSKTVWRSSPDTQWHVISLVENDNQITAYMDGGQVGKDVAGNRPVSFRIGGGLLDNPWDWSNLEIAFMKVNVGVHPLNPSALNERTNLLQP